MKATIHGTRMAQPRFLVIAGSGIGDILLATPITRALRRAHPEARIDALVPQGRGGILEGNPDIDTTLEVCKRQGFRGYAKYVGRIWRRYDLALSVRAGDRSIFNAWIGGRKRVSMVKAHLKGSCWQRKLLHSAIESDSRSHVVVNGLRLLDACGMPRSYELVPPICSPGARAALDSLLPFSRKHKPYAVLHLYPRNPYKCWTAKGWAAVIRYLSERGLAVVITGSGEQQEQRHIRTVLSTGGTHHVLNLSGQLSLRQVSALLADASLYVGSDTGITHLSAAHGGPTVALFGPSDPVRWGPWPTGCTEDSSPFVRNGCQRVSNVFVVQRDGDCIACGKEGCENDPHRPSRCMEELPAAQVLSAVDDALGARW